MGNLARFDIPEQNLELIINQQSGEVLTSQTALSRMLRIPETSIRRWLKQLRDSRQICEPIIAKIPTTGGFKRATLYNEETILKAFLKYRPEMVNKFNQAGLRMYLHHLARFEIHSSA